MHHLVSSRDPPTPCSCARGWRGRSLGDGQRKVPTAQSTSTGGQEDADRKPQCIWPVKGGKHSARGCSLRGSSCPRGGRLGAAPGLVGKASVGQINWNLEPYWAPLGLSVITSDHHDLLRMMNSSLPLPSESHTILCWANPKSEPRGEGDSGTHRSPSLARLMGPSPVQMVTPGIASWSKGGGGGRCRPAQHTSQFLLL